MVGEPTELKVTFRSPIPLAKGDLVRFTMPASLVQNMGYPYRSCEGYEPLLDLHCVLQGLNSLIVTINTEGTIVSDTPITIAIKNVTNAGSTESTEPIQISVTDRNGYAITRTGEGVATLAMVAEETGTLVFASVTNSQGVASRPSPFKFMLVNKHTLPPNAKIKITVP